MIRDNILNRISKKNWNVFQKLQSKESSCNLPKSTISIGSNKLHVTLLQQETCSPSEVK